MKERTLILIKPDAISKRLTGIIIDRIEHLGLDMKAAKVRIMTEELAREHYSNLAGKPFLQDVINFVQKKSGSNNFSLLDGFPPRPLTDYNKTIKELHLEGSLLTQRIN